MVKRKLKTKSKKITPLREPKMKSFRISHHDLPFMTMSATKQTLYWSLLMLIVFVLELWILSIQFNVLDVTSSTVFI